jgi:hypothetical protein
MIKKAIVMAAIEATSDKTVNPASYWRYREGYICISCMG